MQILSFINIPFILRNFSLSWNFLYLQRKFLEKEYCKDENFSEYGPWFKHILFTIRQQLITKLYDTFFND